MLGDAATAALPPGADGSCQGLIHGRTEVVEAVHLPAASLSPRDAPGTSPQPAAATAFLWMF